jgi:hypothetical protein
LKIDARLLALGPRLNFGGERGRRAEGQHRILTGRRAPTFFGITFLLDTLAHRSVGLARRRRIDHPAAAPDLNRAAWVFSGIVGACLH